MYQLYYCRGKASLTPHMLDLIAQQPAINTGRSPGEVWVTRLRLPVFPDTR